MFDHLKELKEALITQDGIRYRPVLRRSLSSASLHINQNQLQQLYTNFRSSQVRKSFMLPTISSTNKVAGNEAEKGLVTCDHQHGNGNDKSMKDQEEIRY